MTSPTLQSERPHVSEGQVSGERGSPSAHSGRWLTKAVIVLIVFPVFADVIYILVAYPVGLILMPILPPSGAWTSVIAKAVVIISVLTGLAGSFWVCRLAWPKDPHDSSAPTATDGKSGPGER